MNGTTHILVVILDNCVLLGIANSCYINCPFACYQILQQMRNDTALLTKEEGGSPIQNPSTAAEDARLASLISLDAILKQVKV